MHTDETCDYKKIADSLGEQLRREQAKYADALRRLDDAEKERDRYAEQGMAYAVLEDRCARLSAEIAALKNRGLGS